MWKYFYFSWALLNNAMCLAAGVRRVASPVTSVNIFGREVFIKRDDILNECGLSGNKARKFMHFSNLENTPSVVGSFGGLQSNSMLAIATMASTIPGCSFVYFVKRTPRVFAEGNNDNFAKAIELGMRVNAV